MQLLNTSHQDNLAQNRHPLRCGSRRFFPPYLSVRLQKLPTRALRLNNFERAYGARAFTLIEIVITMAIFAVLVGVGLFMTMDSFRSYLSRSERDTIVSELQSARSSAMANLYQVPWGVCYDGTDYVIFRTSYVAGASTNQATAASTNATVTSTSNQFSCTTGGIIFTQLSGATTATTITIVQNAKTQTVTTNNEGTIIW